MTPLREELLRDKKYPTLPLLAALIVCLLAGPLQAQEARLPNEEAILVMHTSELAATAKNCNLEWQPYLDAFMAWQDRRGLERSTNYQHQGVVSLRAIGAWKESTSNKLRPEDCRQGPAQAH